MKAILASVLLISVEAATLFGQATSSRKLEFEVASIRPGAVITAGSTTPVSGGLKMDGQQMHASLMTLRDYIAIANKLPIHRVEVPEWMMSARFDISATLPEGSKNDQMPEMLATLLNERFHIKSHRASKDYPVYALTVAKGGILAKEDPLDAEERTIDATGTGSASGTFVKLPRGASFSMGGSKIEVKKFAMAGLADVLTRFMDRPVVDQTDLKETYDISLELTQEDFMAMMVRSANSAGIVLPPQAQKVLETATGDSLHRELAKNGLKIEGKKAPLDVLVIDSADKTPSEN